MKSTLELHVMNDDYAVVDLIERTDFTGYAFLPNEFVAFQSDTGNGVIVEEVYPARRVEFFRVTHTEEATDKLLVSG